MTTKLNIRSLAAIVEIRFQPVIKTISESQSKRI